LLRSNGDSVDQNCVVVTTTPSEWRPKHVGENTVNKLHHNIKVHFVGCLYILDPVNAQKAENLNILELPVLRCKPTPKPRPTFQFFYVLLTVHLSIILATDQLNAQIPVL